MLLSRLIAYALPALPLAALALPLYILVPTFYAETMGLPLAAVGGALLVVRIFDAVNDPLIGWAADRWRPSFGRRRLFFLLSLPLTALAAVMLFWPPQGVGVSYLVLWGSVLAAGYTATLLPYSAWGAELAGDYAARSRITAWREAFTLVGTLVAIVVPFAVDGGANWPLPGLAVLGLVVGALLVVFGVVAVRAVPEPREHSVRRLRLGEGVRAMAANGPFRRLIVAYFVNGLANGIPATLFLYFVSERLGAADMRGPLLLLYFASGIAGVPLAALLSRRFGKHRTWCAAMIANIGFFTLVPLLATGDVAAFAAICVATGICLGFDLSLPPAIQADVIDVDTAASGEQRSGLYFAAWSLATKLSLALGVGLVFPLLDAAGFRPEGGNAEGAVTVLVAAYVWLPVALKLVAVALMWNFPLGAVEQARLRTTIEARQLP